MHQAVREVRLRTSSGHYFVTVKAIDGRRISAVVTGTTIPVGVKANQRRIPRRQGRLLHFDRSSHRGDALAPGTELYGPIHKVRGQTVPFVMSWHAAVPDELRRLAVADPLATLIGRAKQTTRLARALG